MTLVCVRHPQSVPNLHIGDATFWPSWEIKQKFGGVPDHKVSCTPEGEEHGLRIATEVLNLGIPDVVYHSGYQRVLPIVESLRDQTSESINVVERYLVRERDPGYCHDMTLEEVNQYFPWLLAYWNMVGGFYARPPGGESMADVCLRAEQFLQLLTQLEGMVVLVGHKNFFWCLWKLIEKWATQNKIVWPKNRKPQNGSITIYERRNESYVFTKHIEVL